MSSLQPLRILIASFFFCACSIQNPPVSNEDTNDTLSIIEIDSLELVPEKDLSLLIMPIDSSQEWSFSIDITDHKYILNLDNSVYQFDSCDRMIHQGGTGNYCEDSYVLYNDTITASIFLRAKYCFTSEIGLNGFTRDSISQFSAVIALSSPHSTELLLGEGKASKVMMSEYYEDLYSNEIDWETILEIDTDTIVGEIGDNDLHVKEYYDKLMSHKKNLDHISWGMEPGWDLTAKNDIATLSFFYFDNSTLNKNPNVRWKYNEEDCIKIHQFNNDSINITLMSIDHTRNECGCNYSNFSSQCGCPLDQIGYGAYSMYLHIYTKKEVFGLLGCGINF